jgi:hypothetical protein
VQLTVSLVGARATGVAVILVDQGWRLCSAPVGQQRPSHPKPFIIDPGRQKQADLAPSHRAALAHRRPAAMARIEDPVEVVDVRHEKNDDTCQRSHCMGPSMEAVCRTAFSARLLGVLSFLACQTAFGQEELELVASDESQRQLVEQIQALHARDGAHAEGLIGPFSELARLYEQSGDYALAVAALDRAAYLVRVNRGVHSLDQGPLLQQAIRNARAGGHLAAAWDREHDLLDLAAQHPEDLRTVPLFREVAEGWCLAPVFGGR